MRELADGTLLTVVRATRLDTKVLAPLVAESQGEGWDFLARMRDEWDSQANRYDKPGEALFLALADGRLVGTCGLNVDPYLADPAIGRVRHLYVLYAFRRVGLASALVQAACAEARQGFQWLTLRTRNPDAARLYRRLGFTESDRFAHATHWMALADG